MKYTLKQLFESKDDFDYLKSINAKSLSKGQRPPKGVPPKDFYKDLKTKVDKEAEQGPIFDQNVLSNVLEIETEVPQNVLQWIANQIKDGHDVDLSDNNLTRLLNYLSVEDTDLKTTSYTDVAGDLEHTVYDTDFKSFGKYSGKNVVYSFEDGWTFVEVGIQDAETEGEEMQNCIGDYCEAIYDEEVFLYSLRDPQNNPHVTIEVNEYDEAVQIKGKQNEYPKDKFWVYITTFLNHNSFTNVDPLFKSEMDSKSTEEILRLEDQVVLANDENVETRFKLTANPNLTPEAQMVLANDEIRDVRFRLSGNSNLVPEVQQILANDETPDVRFRLTANPNLVPEVQQILANDENVDVRSMLTGNSNLAPEAQMVLANDETPDVRSKLSGNSNLVPEAQQILANDEEVVIQNTLAQNSNLAPETQMILVNNQGEDSRSRIYLARNPIVSSEVQMVLANDEQQRVRSYLAKNPNLTSEAQMVLANDENEEVRATIAANPDIAPETQMTIANDEQAVARFRLTANPNLHPEVQMVLANDEKAEVRRVIAQNPKLTPAVQRILVNDAIAKVRLALLDARNITPSVLKKLTTDVDQHIRNVALSHPRYYQYFGQQESKTNKYSLKFLYEMNTSP